MVAQAGPKTAVNCQGFSFFLSLGRSKQDGRESHRVDVFVA